MKKAIVIGTGASGLAATLELARKGIEVVALERARQLGGYLNPFSRKHFVFDPGVHYVGDCAEGAMTHDILSGLGLDVEELFCPMDPDGYDVFRFPGFELRVPAGCDAYADRLIETFPEDRSEIERFFVLLRRFVKAVDGSPLSAFERFQSLTDQNPGTLSWTTMTFASLLRARIRNPKLRAVLAAQWGGSGVPPSQSSAALSLGYIAHYLEGGYFPRGSSGRLRDVMVERARTHGARFRRRAEVQTIRTRRGRIVGVTLADGEELDADVVISTIDPTLTYGSLLGLDQLPPALQRKVERTKPSFGCLSIFLGMRRDLRQFGLGACNVWDFPSWDVEAGSERILAGEMPSPTAFVLSPNSLKDDTGSMAPEGCSTLEINTPAPFELVRPWQAQASLERGPGYETVKRAMADPVLAAVHERWPNLVGDVLVEEVATPVTHAHYTNAVAGGIYGPLASIDQYGPYAFRIDSPIEGLYLAGSGVFGPGVACCLGSGWFAARRACGNSR